MGCAIYMQVSKRKEKRDVVRAYPVDTAVHISSDLSGHRSCCCCSSVSPFFHDIPKSINLTQPSSVKRMFLGLISLCAMF